MMTIENYLQRNASLYPDKIAIICRGEEITYSRLWQLVESKAIALRKQYQPHHVVAIRTSQSIDFLVTYFALHVADAVALPLEHDIPQSRFEEIANRYAGFIAPEEVADILFTTGTTGKSKGVMISHRTIIADAENLIDSMEFSHDLLFVINGPLNHIGSLSKVYPTVMMGATLYILESLKDLDAFFAAFDYPCTKVATFLVPASIRILLQLAKNKLATYADKIDFIETGAAPMAHSDMLELCRLLPKTRLYNTFASTETGIVATYTSSAPVRAAFIEADFYIGLGPIFGRKQGGTLASPSQEMLDTSLPKNDEIRIALSDVGIPFRDPGLNNSSEYILEKRTEERHEKRHTEKISSAVKTPIFLAQEMDDEKLKRRVERNLAKMNIPSTTSPEAKYIVEIENDYQEKQSIENNSRNRILNMAKKLKKSKKW